MIGSARSPRPQRKGGAGTHVGRARRHRRGFRAPARCRSETGVPEPFPRFCVAMGVGAVSRRCCAAMPGPTGELPALLASSLARVEGRELSRPSRPSAPARAGLKTGVRGLRLPRGRVGGAAFPCPVPCGRSEDRRSFLGLCYQAGEAGLGAGRGVFVKDPAARHPIEQGDGLRQLLLTGFLIAGGDGGAEALDCGSQAAPMVPSAKALLLILANAFLRGFAVGHTSPNPMFSK